MCAIAYFGVDVNQKGYAETDAFSDASGFATGLMVVYYIACTIVALFLARLANKVGPKHVHTAALFLAAICLYLLTHIGSADNTKILYLPMIGIGVAWASIVGIPYVMATEMIRKERRGVYMGVINMMIVVPQLLRPSPSASSTRTCSATTLSTPCSSSQSSSSSPACSSSGSTPTRTRTRWCVPPSPRPRPPSPERAPHERMTSVTYSTIVAGVGNLEENTHVMRPGL